MFVTSCINSCTMNQSQPYTWLIYNSRFTISPLAAKPYTPRPVAPEDLPVDYSGFIAVILGVSGVMFKYKICSWLAIIFCAQSLANMRNLENDLKQISMAMMFAIMGLVTNYLGPNRPATKK